MLPANKLKILVVGSGGREHALCWKISQSTQVQQIWCAPGNGGTAGTDKTKNVDIKVSDFEGIGNFARHEKIDLIVVGPDNPLADGIVDYLENLGLRAFGPYQAEARLESSKSFAKDFMSRHGIPTARYFVSEDHQQALEFVRDNDWARVIKADGLALGKGVFVTDSAAEAEQALDVAFKERRFGHAGARVVIEEKLVGEEISLLMFCDGHSLELMPACQDHKRRLDGDRGPNTGGMGAYSPVPLWDRCRHVVEQEIVDPLRRILASNAVHYKGILYAGLLISAGDQQTSPAAEYKPYVLEFNARFGDPETQVILPLLENDLVEILWACTQGQLSAHRPVWRNGAACCVVACADTYPDSSSQDKEITLGQLPPGSHVFHAGTKSAGGKILTNGGRVLNVVGCADDLSGAVACSYEALKSVSFAGMDYRRDIARRSLVECR